MDLVELTRALGVLAEGALHRDRLALSPSG